MTDEKKINPTAKARIVGLNPDIHFQDVEVLKKFEFDGEEWMVHLGHNSLIRTLVISEWKTGMPFKIYNLNPTEELDEENINRYCEDFKNPNSRKIIHMKLPSQINGVE